MSIHEPDGIAEAFDDTIRLAVSAAGRVAEARVRERQQQLHDAQAQSEQSTRQLNARLDAERASARAELAPVHHGQWWEQAGPEDIGRAWETASAWRDVGPDVARAGERIRTEVHHRYGIDADNPTVSRPSAEQEHANRAEAQAQAQDARTRSQQADAALLLASAEHADQQDASLTEHAYDTPERRRALAEQLAGAGVEPDAVEAAILADTSQAKPPENAVVDIPRRPTSPRRQRTSATKRQITRQDRGR